MLPNKIKPFTNELLSSYLIRLAHKNGTNLRTLSKLVFGSDKLIFNDIDKVLSKHEINKISDFSQISFSTIENLLLYTRIYKINLSPLSKNTKWKWIIPSGSKYTHKTNGINFCPLCLTKDMPHFTIFNRLSWNISCAEHKILLYSKCPQCSRPFSQHLKEFNEPLSLCSYCKFDLATLDQSIVSSASYELQTYLNKCFIEGQVLKSNYLIEDTSIQQLFYTIRIFIVFFINIKDNHHILNELSQYTNIVTDYSFHTSYGDSYDNLLPIHRMLLMHNAAILLQQDIDILKFILKKCNITYRQFMGSSSFIPHSNTIKKVVSNLKVSTHESHCANSKKELVPKSKDVVDLLMDEIEKYLK